jgi:hypothetical protein
MRRIRVVVAIIVAAGALALLSSSALAAAPPSFGSPGCPGLIVAEFNHNSGVGGASGNPNSSAGPGYFLRQGTASAVHDVQAVFCP